MPRFCRPPLVTFALLAAYLVGGTAGGWLHAHHHLAEHDGAEHTHGDAEHHDDAHHQDEHQHCESDHDGAADHTPTHHDEDCALCRFEGQPTLPVQVAQLEQTEAVRVEIVALSVGAPDCDLARTTHSRAPPLPC